MKISCSEDATALDESSEICSEHEKSSSDSSEDHEESGLPGE